MSRRYFFSLCCVVALACSRGAPAGEAVPAVVRVAAAADLQPAGPELVAAFKAAHPGMDVVFTFGSSGMFHEQLQRGAPHDVFLSADRGYPNRLAAAGVAVPGSVFAYAQGRLALWVPANSPLNIDVEGVRALDPLRVRAVAMANPEHAPYGRAAREVLQRAGRWDGLQGRMVMGENIAQAAHYAVSGSADAAMVALSLALSPRMREAGRHVVIPADEHAPLVQAGCILASSQVRAAAEAFAAFMLTESTRAILLRHGFDAPPEPTDAR